MTGARTSFTVRIAPARQIGGAQLGIRLCDERTPDLFDHLVGARQQHRRHGEAEHPGGLGVDDQLELARLYDRKVGGSSAVLSFVRSTGGTGSEAP